MPGARWILLVAIAAIVYGVGITYRNQKKVLSDAAVAAPAILPADLSALSSKYHHQVTDHGRMLADIEAEELRQVKDSSYIDLKNVSMRLSCKDGVSYNLVKSAAATFYTNDERLYSEGAVEMTLKVPLEDQPQHQHHKLVSIKSSGVTFDTATGKAETDRPSSFVFENGDGRATGAFYDPSTHQLLMKSDVEVDWKPVGPHAKLMKIEAGSLEYRESGNEILLKPWGRHDPGQHRGRGRKSRHPPAGRRRAATRSCSSIDTTKAHGIDNYPNRKLQYARRPALDDLRRGRPGGQDHRRGERHSHGYLWRPPKRPCRRIGWTWSSNPAIARARCSSAVASGHSVVTSRPLPMPNVQPGETHVLRSDRLEMKMRPGGREIATVITHSAGNLEFLPNSAGAAPPPSGRPGHRDRVRAAEPHRIVPRHSTSARRPTPPPTRRNAIAAQSITASKRSLAHFDPKTSQLATMEQTGDFTYHEGDRQARAAKAHARSATRT